MRGSRQRHYTPQLLQKIQLLNVVCSILSASDKVNLDLTWHKECPSGLFTHTKNLSLHRLNVLACMQAYSSPSRLFIHTESLSWQSFNVLACMQAFSSPGHAGGGPNGEGEAVSRPSMSKLIGGEAPAGQSRMANSLQQVGLQSVTSALLPTRHLCLCCGWA